MQLHVCTFSALHFLMIVLAADLLALAVLVKLRALDLSGTRVTISGLENFKTLPMLSHLATSSQ